MPAKVKDSRAKRKLYEGVRAASVSMRACVCVCVCVCARGGESGLCEDERVRAWMR